MSMHWRGSGPRLSKLITPILRGADPVTEGKPDLPEPLLHRVNETTRPVDPPPSPEPHHRPWTATRAPSMRTPRVMHRLSGSTGEVIPQGSCSCTSTHKKLTAHRLSNLVVIITQRALQHAMLDLSPTTGTSPATCPISQGISQRAHSTLTSTKRTHPK